MMESMISLSQLTRTSLAVHELRKNNIPFTSVICEPTTGGVSASYATLGDFIISEKGATLAFAGRRVIEGTVRETLPDDFQKSSWALEMGQIDLIVERKYLNSTIGTLLNVLLKKAEAQAKQDSNVTLDKSLKESA